MSDQQVDRYIKGAKKAERRKQLRSANKKMKRSAPEKRTRRRDWMPAHLDVDEMDDWEQTERIMPLTESERRRTIEQMAFHRAPNEPGEPEAIPDGLAGRVIEAGKGIYRVDLGDEVVLCGLRGSISAEASGYLNPVAVGDEVIVNADGAVIDHVLPRRSVIARPDTYYTHMQQILAANIDQVLVVAAWRSPQIWLEMIDRYLVFAARNELTALICVNKADLIEDEAEFASTLAPYRALGYTVIRTSVVSGEGIAELREHLHGQATVLSGMSGVGKSSLIAMVQPGLELRTSDVSEFWGEGMHTTTQATWLKLGEAGAVVDTPGIREFGLAGLEPDELTAFFPEIEAAASGCRFRDCQHISEPGCAVSRAAEQGEIAASRYHSYKLIHTDLTKQEG